MLLHVVGVGLVDGQAELAQLTPVPGRVPGQVPALQVMLQVARPAAAVLAVAAAPSRRRLARRPLGRHQVPGQPVEGDPVAVRVQRLGRELVALVEVLGQVAVLGKGGRAQVAHVAVGVLGDVVQFGVRLDVADALGGELTALTALPALGPSSVPKVCIKFHFLGFKNVQQFHCLIQYERN